MPNPVRIISFICLVLFIGGCVKDDLPVKDYYEASGVFICNEGNFTYDNASLSFYNTETGMVANQVFYNANNFPLGDVCQSMGIRDTLGYLVVNNSGKIVVISTNTFKYVATIKGLTSPRYIGFINNHKAYVSDLYNPQMTIINPETFQVTGSIKVGRGTEQMVIYDHWVFVTSWSFNNKVYQIDCNTDSVTDSVTVNKQPNSIALDKNNKLWVLCDGGFEGSAYGRGKPALTRIDAKNFTVEQVMEFDDTQSAPTRLCLNGTRDTLLFINGSWGSAGNSGNGIYRMPVTATSLPDTTFIPEGSQLFYGLAIDPKTSVIYASDALDYMQGGTVYRYTMQGKKLNSFKAGIAPGFFCFKP